MDLELPDGTVIEGVPEGTSKMDILRKLYEKDPKGDAYTKLALYMLKHEGWGTGVPKFAEQMGGKVTDLTGSPALGYLSNVGIQAIPALFGFKPVGSTTSLAQKPAEWLMQSAVKPSAADRASGDAGRAFGAMLKEDIGPTAGGMDKASDLVRSINTNV